MSVTWEQIQTAVEALSSEAVSMLQDIVKIPSLVGNPGEREIQEYMERVLKDMELSKVDKWEINMEEIKGLKGFSPPIGEWRDKFNLVGVHKPAGEAKGKSVIFNGHLDIVPTGPVDLWTHGPFSADIDGDWLYGRGCGDMKAGVVAMIYAFKALRHLGFQPASEVQFHCVVEEECTGNGALDIIHKGYRADACIIPEPLPFIMTAQLGVVWMHITTTGKPAHVWDTSAGINAIEGSMLLYKKMKELAEEWNKPEVRHPFYKGEKHPINFNLGKIEGGEWGSTVPSRCTMIVRIGFFPDKHVAHIQKQMETFIQDTSKEIGITTTVSYGGFVADGCELSPEADLIQSLATAYRDAKVDEQDVIIKPACCTTDARFYQNNANIPTTCYGPKSVRNVHGIDEKVSLQSVKEVTRVLCMFMVQWCGLEPATKPTGERPAKQQKK